MTTEALVNYFWPTRFNPNVTLMVRAGRAIHWTLASFSAIISFVSIVTAVGRPDHAPINMGAYILFMLTLCLLGRALRYVLAQE